MFEVGFTEIVLILGLALLVLGPEKLPGLAEKIGRWTGRARAMARQLRTQLEHEVTLEELARSKQTHGSSSPSASTPPDAPTPPEAATDVDGAPKAASPNEPAPTGHEHAQAEHNPSDASTTKAAQ
ncbi:MAG: twin-arginine translocase subunit TatB [Xanthomonadaceae bacterium]|nr:twin-arginine translocase subunit TatB [Xanthomonadaceae bacterium]